MSGFKHIRVECPSCKKTWEKAMNATLTNDETTSGHQCDTSTFEDGRNYMALTSIVESESEKNNGRIESLEQTDSS